MTKDQYIAWRPKFDAAMAAGEPWSNIAECREADELIKETTLANFKVWAEQNLTKPGEGSEFFEWTLTVSRHLFGSGETDEMLTALKCYPEWM